MKLYAQTRIRRSRQALGDLSIVAWIALWGWIAWLVHGAIMKLAVPGRSLEDAGTRLASDLDSAGNQAGSVPFVGDSLKKPLVSAGGAGTQLAQAGQAEQDAVAHLAMLFALMVFAVPVVLVLLLWLPRRLRWMRRASAVQRLLDTDGGGELFALRALVGPLPALAAVSRLYGDPAAAWRRGDPDATAELSRLGLARLGLRPGGRRYGGRLRRDRGADGR
jgi:hypothetical protein